MEKSKLARIADTPLHCWTCPQLDTCKQAPNMCANTPATEPYYLSDGASLYCEDCAPDGAYAVGSQETDCPSHCDICGAPLLCTLTDEGVAYVREALSRPDGAGCCRVLWPVLFAEYLDTE